MKKERRNSDVGIFNIAWRLMHRIIDISKWQGLIDFRALKRDWDEKKFFGVIVRIGYNQSQRDNKAHRNVAECKRLGIPVGLYWYAPEPINERHVIPIVKIFHDWCKVYKPEYPCFLDIEGVQEYQKITPVAELFINECLKRKIYPGLYGSEKVLWTALDKSVIERNDVARWIARYSGKMPAYNPNIWQYTSSGRVQGIGGSVDFNRCYTDYKKIIKEGGFNGWTC